jgi:mevalonate kinase
MYNIAMFIGVYGGKSLGAGKGDSLLILLNKKIWRAKYNKY